MNKRIEEEFLEEYKKNVLDPEIRKELISKTKEYADVYYVDEAPFHDLTDSGILRVINQQERNVIDH